MPEALKVTLVQATSGLNFSYSVPESYCIVATHTVTTPIAHIDTRRAHFFVNTPLINRLSDKNPQIPQSWYVLFLIRWVNWQLHHMNTASFAREPMLLSLRCISLFAIASLSSCHHMTPSS
jgi:hypothetical protein